MDFRLRAVTILLLFLATGAVSQDVPTPIPLTVKEAEILIYLLPVAHELRAQHMDIGFELQGQPSQGGKYIFWVYNSVRKSHGSVTIGHYSVDKATGEVSDEDLSKPIRSVELAGVQRILRRSHNSATQ